MRRREYRTRCAALWQHQSIGLAFFSAEELIQIPTRIYTSLTGSYYLGEIITPVLSNQIMALFFTLLIQSLRSPI